MIKLEVIEGFTLGRFNELKNVQRKGADTKDLLNPGDTFECEKELADYLLGNNRYQKPYVKIIEVIPIEEEDVKVIAEQVNKAVKKSKKGKK